MKTIVITFALLTVLAPCAPASADAMIGMGAMRSPGPDDPHMRLSPARPSAPGDAQRAADLAERVGRNIARYRDVARAEADGYRPFGDVPEARVVHYVHPRRARAERRRIDPERPGSLLYEKRNGGLQLVGAMFTAPQGSGPDALDARVPLSQARWHLHTNVCTPRPIWSREKWARRFEDGPHAGRMVYGTFSPTATKRDCAEVGGRFHETILGWMVHVYPYRAPTMRWHGDHHGG